MRKNNLMGFLLDPRLGSVVCLYCRREEADVCCPPAQPAADLATSYSRLPLGFINQGTPWQSRLLFRA